MNTTRMTQSPESKPSAPLEVSPRIHADIWHKIMFVSGILLAACFFVPVSRSWPSPAALFALELSEWSNSAVTLFDHFNGFCAHTTAYLFGALMAISAAGRLLGRVRLSRACRLSVFMLLMFVGFLAFLETWANNWSDLAKGIWMPFAAGITATVGALAYIVTATRLGPKAMICYEFAGSLAAVVWFAFSWSSASIVSSVALLASLGLLLGVLGEARLVLRLAWLDTEWLLLTCLLGRRQLNQEAIA